MKKFIKITFALLLLFCSYVFTSIYIMSDNFADSYKLNRGDVFKMDTPIPITASYNGVKITKGLSGKNVGDNFDIDLKIFGVIPFSTVSVEIVDSMYVQVLGEPFGMKIYTDGVLVVGSTDILTGQGKINPALNAGIKVGDYIKTVNGKTITCNEDLLQLVSESQGSTMKFEVIRDEKISVYNVEPQKEKDSGIYRIGIWVRDSSAGIGTLTFYSPSNNVVCGLGHGICDTDTDDLLKVYKGELVKASIIGVEKGSSGNPGALKGKLSYDSIANVSLNCECGVYGIIGEKATQNKLTKVALKQEVKDGYAQILCTVEGETPKYYDCEIKKIGDKTAKTQNLIVKVTDKALISKTGGIVQGMSGSPILQDGKLVGALTHVLVDDSKTGYGIYAENMLETAESVAEEELKQAS